MNSLLIATHLLTPALERTKQTFHCVGGVANGVDYLRFTLVEILGELLLPVGAGAPALRAGLWFFPLVACGAAHVALVVRVEPVLKSTCRIVRKIPCTF